MCTFTHTSKMKQSGGCADIRTLGAAEPTLREAVWNSTWCLDTLASLCPSGSLVASCLSEAGAVTPHLLLRAWKMWVTCLRSEVGAFPAAEQMGTCAGKGRPLAHFCILLTQSRWGNQVPGRGQGGMQSNSAGFLEERGPVQVGRVTAIPHHSHAGGGPIIPITSLICLVPFAPPIPRSTSQQRVSTGCKPFIPPQSLHFTSSYQQHSERSHDHYSNITELQWELSYDIKWKSLYIPRVPSLAHLVEKNDHRPLDHLVNWSKRHLAILNLEDSCQVTRFHKYTSANYHSLEIGTDSVVVKIKIYTQKIIMVIHLFFVFFFKQI